MNKQMKQHLEALVTAMVNEDTKAEKAAFHDYLSVKTQHLLSEESADDEEVDADLDDEEKDNKKMKKDLDKADKDVKKAKKDQKKDVEDEDMKCEECGKEPCECED